MDPRGHRYLGRQLLVTYEIFDCIPLRPIRLGTNGYQLHVSDVGMRACSGPAKVCVAEIAHRFLDGPPQVPHARIAVVDPGETV